MLFCCLWRNVETSCHKHFGIVYRHQQTPPLTIPAISVITWGTVVRRRHVDNTLPVAALTARSETRYRLRIAISAYPTCIRRHCEARSGRCIAMPFGEQKLEWLGYPKVKKYEDVYSFWQNSRTWQTDTHTHRERLRITTGPRLHRIARQKLATTSSYTWLDGRWCCVIASGQSCTCY